MRVAVNALCAATGGARTHLTAILPRMAEIGPSHHFVVFAPAGDAGAFSCEGRPNVTTVTVAVDAVATAKRILWENAVLPSRVKAAASDVALYPANLSPVFGGARRVIVVHNVQPFYRELYADYGWRGRLRLAILRRATLHFIRRAEGTVFLSDAGKADCLRGTTIEPRADVVIPHGVDADFGAGDAAAARLAVARRWNVPARYILTVSHLYAYKRIESLVDGFGLVPPHLRAGRKLLIAGHPYDRAYASRLRAHVAASRLAEDIVFLGGVSGDELSTLHTGADVVAFLSVCENCPNSVLEALVSGKPTLLSDRPVMRELAGDGAAFADPDRPEGVARQLERILGDSEAAAELGRRGRRRAATYSWEAAASRLLEFLERVAARR